MRRCRGQVQRQRLGELLLGEVDYCKTSDEFWTIADRLGFVVSIESESGTDIFSPVVISVQGNPSLILHYPTLRAEDENWWALADSLYPAYTSDVKKSSVESQHAEHSFRALRGPSLDKALGDREVLIN